jgi:acyl-coenzyme A thioesterase PaaI-like protein
MTTERVPLDPEKTFGANQPCFGCSPTHPIGFHLEPYREGDEVCVDFTPGEKYQGPPGLMHGGLVLTLADELGAWVVLGLKERFGFTAAVEARLQKPVRIGVPVHGRGKITSDTPRIVKMAIELSQEGEGVFRGTFTFALLDRAGAEKLLGGPLPETWIRFAR